MSVDHNEQEKALLGKENVPIILSSNLAKWQLSRHYPDYLATQEGTTVTIESPAGTGYSCQVSELPYMLLCERQRVDELVAEVKRLRGG